MRNITVYYASKGVNVIIDKFPSECGMCHKNIEPKFLTGVFVKGDEKSTQMEAAFQCTNIKCNSIIIGYYIRNQNNGHYFFKKNAPIVPKEKPFNEDVTEISKNFVSIFNQSLYAEQTGLTLISGIGYRKALEFLIKDYLIYLTPDREDKIIKMPLNQCINEMDNQNIKEISKRATWIGNDEAHYTRKWEDKDVNDLKKLIDVTVYFISMDVAAKKYLEEMS